MSVWQWSAVIDGLVKKHGGKEEITNDDFEDFNAWVAKDREAQLIANG